MIIIRLVLISFVCTNFVRLYEKRRALVFVYKMDTTNVCRLCGKDAGRNFYKVFDKNEGGQQILQLIHKCIPVLVSVRNNLDDSWVMFVFLEGISKRPIHERYLPEML